MVLLYYLLQSIAIYSCKTNIFVTEITFYQSHSMITKPVTIYDIAKKLQLAPSTISRGLKRHSSVSERTQERILKTAEEMGYRANTFAINLRNRKTSTIGIIVPKLNSYFMSQVIAGIEGVVNNAGYTLLISQSLEDVSKEIINVQTMFDNRVAGLLVSLAENTKETSHFNRIQKQGIPVLFFDRTPVGSDLPAITINNESAGYKLTRHLIEQGAKNIVHITGNQLSNVYRERLVGYKRALQEFGLPFEPQNLLINDLSEQAGIDAAHYILKVKADGVFVANDHCAASCMHELKHRGRKVPEDILIAGFNNDMISRIVDPGLTTVDYPGFQMGELAAKNLLAHIAQRIDINLTSNIILKTPLLIRASSLRKN